MISWRALRSYQDANLFSARMEACVELHQDAFEIRTYVTRSEEFSPDVAERARSYYEAAGMRSLQNMTRLWLLGPKPLSDSAQALSDAASALASAMQTPDEADDAAAQARFVESHREFSSQCRTVLTTPETISLF
jgi:hypothetical protein